MRVDVERTRLGVCRSPGMVIIARVTLCNARTLARSGAFMFTLCASPDVLVWMDFLRHRIINIRASCCLHLVRKKRPSNDQGRGTVNAGPHSHFPTHSLSIPESDGLNHTAILRSKANFEVAPDEVRVRSPKWAFRKGATLLAGLILDDE